MALSFPASPTVGQQYTDSNRTWEWNGQTWEAISSADFGTGSLTIPVSSTLPTGEGQIVFDGTTDTLHIGEGVGSVQIAKDADIPQSIIELGITDGTAGQFLSTDGAGNFTFTTVTGGSGATTLDELTDVTAAGATNGQVLTADGAGNFTFLSIAGGGAETVTSLAYNNATSMLTYTDEAGADTVLDLTNLLDDTNIITDVNGQTGSVSLTLDNLADVTAAGSTVGQMLTSDGAGAYTFTTPYGDPDVATFLDGNLNANIIPNANLTYDIGTDTAQIRFGYISRAYVAELMANYMYANGEIVLRANNGTPQAIRPYDVGGSGSNLGSTSYPWNETHTDNLTVNTSLSVGGTVNTDIDPSATETYDLGNNGARWNEIHAKDGKFQAVSAFNYSSPAQMIFASGSDFVFQGTRINGPSANALDIGENSFPLKTIYTNNIQVNTTLTIPINNTANTADGSMTWDGTNNKLYVGDGTTAIEIGAGGGYGDADVATYLNGNLDTHIIPDTNATYDIGAAEFKIRHLYLSDNSLKFVNASNTEYSMGVDGDGELTFQSVKLSDAAVAKVTSADLDMGGNRVLFSNVYTNLADLPDASAYHGMFAHVHSEAAAYYAHAGSWVKLANDGAGGATTLDALTDVTAAGSANGEVLTSDGAGNFTFEAVSAQLGRNQYAGTTASLADQASGNLDVTGCKTYTLFKISTDVAAWVVLYTDDASRTADTRTYADKGSDPATEGVVAEVITTGAETVIVAPGVIGFNNEGTPTTNIPMRVFNDSGGAATVTVTVDVLTLEA